MPVNKTYLVVHIGGSSMSGLADLLLTSGHTIYGWEKHVEGSRVQRFIEQGVVVFSGRIPEEILLAVDCVVHSSITSSKDIRAALGIGTNTPVYSQFEFINELARDSLSIAITGSYGKTLTTSLLSCIFDAGGYDVSFTCGGIVENYNSNAKLGTSDIWIIEAVETHGNCLWLNPTYGIVLNVEHDTQVPLFTEFIERTAREVFVNVDDPHTRELTGADRANVITFGVDSSSAMFRASNVLFTNDGLTFDLSWDGEVIGTVVTPQNRFFSVYNVLAASAFAVYWGLNIDTVNDGLRHYKGVRNRFDIFSSSDRYILIKDIAHHPESITEVIQKCMRYRREQIIVLYRPHMFKELNEDASATEAALELADAIVLLDIESVKDHLHGGQDAQRFVEARREMNDRWFYFSDHDALITWLEGMLGNSAVIIQMGMYLGMPADTRLTERLSTLLEQQGIT